MNSKEPDKIGNEWTGDLDSLVWEEVKTEHIVKDKWIDFRRSAYRFPDGSEFEPYYSYSRRDYVVIVASDTNGNLLCVRQFRQGIGEVTTEFPAGGIERTDGREYGGRRSKAGEGMVPGEAGTAAGAEGTAADSDAEEALEAAVRELREETGYVSDEWEHLITIPSNATIADNYAYVFRAVNCRKAADQDLDDTEFLNVIKHTPEEIEDLIRQGGFQQAVHVMAWLLACRKQ